MKKYKKILTAISLVLFTVSIGLSWIWFGYKLITILLIFGWANNIQMRINQ